MKAYEIIPFDNQYVNDFYKLNIEWLKTYFYVEPYDEEVLSKPKTYIIDKGGHIFFVKRDGTILGTVALKLTNDPLIFELTKMAVLPNLRSQKIGQQLLLYCIDFANKQQLKALMLYSSLKLENTIYIYRKYGFIETPVEPRLSLCKM
ncbi:GNAT family N-acetyltransferase [Psychroserpens sp.]